MSTDGGGAASHSRGNRMASKLLIIDDEQEWLDILSLLFTRKGYEVQTAEGGVEGLKAIGETMFDLVICDLAMPDLSGIDLLKQVRSCDKTLPFIIMTGVGSIETAVEAVQFGAFHYITKPFKSQDLEILAQRAIEHRQLHRQLESVALHAEPTDISTMVLGSHRGIQDILAKIEKISDSSVPVLIQGETGTGKSLLARLIHEMSGRKGKPFMTIDCGALPENLLESELFGHVKGAFTGALFARRGLMEEGQEGTVFLDEIGELTPCMQVKLLRSIQEREIKPVGSNKNIAIDVRFITATNRDLAHEVEQGTFREDLFYRLAVIPLHLPPLRERADDIILFVGHFVQKFNQRYNKKITEVSPAAMQLLMSQPWKGNIRELENVIERAVLLADEDVISPDLLGFSLNAQPRRADASDMGTGTISLQQAVSDAEKRAIQRALAITQGNRTKAATLLGIGRRTLYDKLEEYKI